MIENNSEKFGYKFLNDLINSNQCISKLYLIA